MERGRDGGRGGGGGGREREKEREGEGEMMMMMMMMGGGSRIPPRSGRPEVERGTCRRHDALRHHPPEGRAEMGYWPGDGLLERWAAG